MTVVVQNCRNCSYIPFYDTSKVPPAWPPLWSSDWRQIVWYEHRLPTHPKLQLQIHCSSWDVVWWEKNCIKQLPTQKPNYTV